MMKKFVGCLLGILLLFSSAHALEEGLYKIRNKATRRFLNMQLAGMTDRARAIQLGKSDMLDEVWRIEKTEGGYTLLNAFSPRYLAVRDDEAVEGATIHVEVNAPYIWQLEERDGAYRIGSGDLNLALPANEASFKNLPTLLMYEGQETALWELIPVEAADELPYMLPLTGSVFQSSCPQIIKQDDTYYMVIQYPHILIKSSKDLLHWERVGTVFKHSDPSWLSKEVPGYAIWAPSAYKIGDKYFLYYSVSTLGKQNSAIGLAVNTTMNPDDPDYNWVDAGMVIRSFTGSEYNCIDSNLSYDEDGHLWLTYGSYWGGIFQREINPETGHLLYPDDENAPRHHVAQRSGGSTAIEAASVVKRGEYYYLFTAFNPMDLTYHNRVGRSKSAHGPFVDRNGKEMLHGGGTVVTKGLIDLEMPGHATVFLDDDGQYYFVGEFFRQDIKDTILMISTIVWDEDGWPQTALTPGLIK